MTTDVDIRGCLRRLAADVARLQGLLEPEPESPAAPDPGEGFRLLDEGEVVDISGGDEVTAASNCQFDPLSGWLGGKDMMVHHGETSGPGGRFQTGSSGCEFIARRPLPSAPAGLKLVGPEGEVREGDAFSGPAPTVTGEASVAAHIGCRIVNWRTPSGHYVLRRVSPILGPADPPPDWAGKWVRCPDGEVRKATGPGAGNWTRMADGTEHANAHCKLWAPEAGEWVHYERDESQKVRQVEEVYSDGTMAFVDGLVVNVDECEPVVWRPLDSDELRGLVGQVLRILDGEDRYLVLAYIDIRKEVVMVVGEDDAGVLSEGAEDLLANWTYADGPRAGQPVARPEEDNK